MEEVDSGNSQQAFSFGRQECFFEKKSRDPAGEEVIHIKITLKIRNN